MSLVEACAWATLRGALIVAIALPLARVVATMAGQAGRSRRMAIWTAMLVPFFCPELFVGYAYANFALPLVHHPWLNEVVYSCIVLMKFLPVAAIVLYFAPPPPLSSEAIHCRRLSLPARQSRLQRMIGLFGYRLRGSAQPYVLAGGVLFLLCFQEFEIASLMGITAGTVGTPKSWTVWLYDKQVGGLLLSESLRYMLLPLAIEIAILLPVIAVVLMSRRLPAADEAPARSISSWNTSIATAYLVLATVAIAVVPSMYVLRQTATGIRVLLSNFTLTREILAGAALATVGGIVAMTIADATIRRSQHSRRGRAALAAACIVSLPGLLGSLVLSLTLLAVFQSAPLYRLYNTAVPLVMASILFLLPRAFLLGALLRALRPGEPVHAAALLRASASQVQRARGGELFWDLSTRGYFWAVVILFIWAYWDLTAPAILAPTAFVTAPVRLYNLMHYGQSAVLSAMLAATIAFPIALLLLAAAIRRPLLRWLNP